MTSSPISTRRPPIRLRVDDHVQLDVLAVLLAQRGGQPLLLVGGQLAGGVHRGHRLLEGLRGQVEELLRAPPPRCPAPGSRPGRRARRWPGGSCRRADRGAAPLRSSAVRELVGQRAAQLGVGVDHLADREQLVADLLAVRAGRAHGGGDRRAARARRAGPCRRSSAGSPRRRPGSSAGSAERRSRRPPGPARTCDSPSTELSVSARRSAASLAHDGGDTEQLLPSVAASSSVRVRAACSAQLGQRLGRGSAQHQDGAPFRSALLGLVSSDSRSARNRSTTRPLRSSSSRHSPDDPTGQRGGQGADLGAQRGQRLLTLGRDLGLRVLLDAGWPRPGPAPLGLGDDRVALLARLLADPGGLLAGVGDLRLELLLGALAPLPWPPRPRRTPAGSRPGGASSPC